MEYGTSQIDKQEAKKYGFGDYSVIVIPNYCVELSDGIKLSMKLWMPFVSLRNTTFAPYPQYEVYKGNNLDESTGTVLEFLPYRKADKCVSRDWRHLWFSSHGYVCIRADQRGTGDSEGYIFGEYLLQEQNDCIELLQWISEQFWSNGNVGMYGKSWGGFNGVQLALRQPPALKTAISLYFTDDRYSTDIHYSGGCIMASDMVDWANQMFAWNARPPSPYHNDDWKNVWMDRLTNAGSCWLDEWLQHQSKDDFWTHGSASKDYSRIEIPILGIGGWRDMYRDPVLKMAENMPQHLFRAIIGPWSHDWPSISIPGPNIDFLQVCLEWWNYHLKGEKNNAMATPLCRLYVQEEHKIQDIPKMMPGFWITTEDWPPSNNFEMIDLTPDNVTGKLDTFNSDFTLQRSASSIPYHTEAGLFFSEYYSIGQNDTGGNQIMTDSMTLFWDSSPLDEDFIILGNCTLTLTFNITNHHEGMVGVRLCDISSDNRSSLITYGVYNLTHIFGHEPDYVQNLKSRKEYTCNIELISCSYTVPSNHKMRLSISSTYFPLAMPFGTPTDIEIITGNDHDNKFDHSHLTCLSIPRLNNAIPKSINLFEEANEYCPIPIIKEKEFYERYIKWNLSTNERVHVTTSNDGKIILPKSNISMDEKCTKTCSIQSTNPTSACIDVNRELFYSWLKDDYDINVDIRAGTVLKCDVNYYYTENRLKINLNGEIFYDKRWKGKIKRLLT